MSVTSRPESTTRIAYAAATWWAAFAAVSFYWAAGGTVGLSTLGDGTESLAAAREPWFVALVAATGAAKLVPVVLALSLGRTRSDRTSLRARLAAVGAIGVLSLLYGGVGLVLKLLVLADLLDAGRPETRGFWGHLLIWDPVWIVGGVLLCATAVFAYRDAVVGETD